MPAMRLYLMLAAVGVVSLVSGCGGHHGTRYSAQKFRACVRAHHRDAFQSPGPRSSQVVLVMTPSFAEWFYFFPDKTGAAKEQASLRAGTTARERKLARLLRTQKDNVLVFAPDSAAWRSTANACLATSRAAAK